MAKSEPSLQPVRGEEGAYREDFGKSVRIWLTREAARRRFESQTDLVLPDIVCDGDEQAEVPSECPATGVLQNPEGPFLWVPQGEDEPGQGFWIRTWSCSPELWKRLARPLAEALFAYYVGRTHGLPVEHHRSATNDLEGVQRDLRLLRKRWSWATDECLLPGYLSIPHSAFAKLEHIIDGQLAWLTTFPLPDPGRPSDFALRRFYFRLRDASRKLGIELGPTRSATFCIFYRVTSDDPRRRDEATNKAFKTVDGVPAWCVTALEAAIKRAQKHAKARKGT